MKELYRLLGEQEKEKKKREGGIELKLMRKENEIEGK